MAKGKKHTKLYKYEYLGDQIVSVPSHGIEVKPGEVVKVKRPIDNPLFKEVK